MVVELEVLDEPEVLEEVDDVLLVELSPRRVVVEVPSVLTVRVVVRAAPLELTRLLVVVEAGVALRAGLEEVVEEELVEPEVLEELVEPEALDELDELDVLEVLEELDELEVPDVLEVLVEPEVPDVLAVVEDVLPVEPELVVVVVLEATRCCRSRALLMGVRVVLVLPVLPDDCAARLAAEMRLEKFCSG